MAALRSRSCACSSISSDTDPSWEPLTSTYKRQLTSRSSVYRHVWICTPEGKLLDRREREKLMWRHDNNQLQPTGEVQATTVTWGQRRCLCLAAGPDCTKGETKQYRRNLQTKPVNHMCRSPVQSELMSLCMHAPELLDYAEQHRWVCGGMGAVSSQIKLWVGGPIAIHRTST